MRAAREGSRKRRGRDWDLEGLLEGLGCALESSLSYVDLRQQVEAARHGGVQLHCLPDGPRRVARESVPAEQVTMEEVEVSSALMQP